MRVTQPFPPRPRLEFIRYDAIGITIAASIRAARARSIRGFCTHLRRGRWQDTSTWRANTTSRSSRWTIPTSSTRSTPEMWSALKQAMDTANADPGLRCIVLAGAGDKAFAAGGDIEEFLTVRATVEQALHYHDDLVAAALDAIRNCPIPTVAAIHGACIGGGLEIAGCCDIRIAGSSARFGAPINRLGFSMYPGEMAGLLDLVGPAVLLEILLEGRILDSTGGARQGPAHPCRRRRSSRAGSP